MKRPATAPARTTAMAAASSRGPLLLLSDDHRQDEEDREGARRPPAPVSSGREERSRMLAASPATPELSPYPAGMGDAGTPGQAPAASRPRMFGGHLEPVMLPWSWARDRLVASHNYWISTTRPDGRPHA